MSKACEVEVSFRGIEARIVKMCERLNSHIQRNGSSIELKRKSEALLKAVRDQYCKY